MNITIRTPQALEGDCGALFAGEFVGTLEYLIGADFGSNAPASFELTPEVKGPGFEVELPLPPETFGTRKWEAEDNVAFALEFACRVSGVPIGPHTIIWRPH